MTETGKKIKALRSAKGFTLKNIADVFEVGISTYSARENRGDFSEEDLSKILRKLKISKEEFEKFKVPGEVFSLSLPETLLSIESKLDVTLSAIAELLAKQSGQSVTGAVNDLTKAVKERYEQSLAELQGR